MCKFSVIVPVYNVENYLENCLMSILNQDYSDMEVLCINDCSTDNSFEILSSFKDDRLKILNTPENRGVSFARNYAMEQARGSYIFFVDSDDVISLNTFKILDEAVSSRPQADSFCFDYNVHVEKDNRSEHYSGCSNYLGKSGYFLVTPDNISDFPAYIWNKVYKKDALKNLNLKFTEGLYFQCPEFNFKFFTQLKKVYYINETLYTYNFRGNSALTGISAGHPERCEDMFKIFYRIYEYAKEKNLLIPYRKEMLRMIAMCISFQKIPEFHERALKLSTELLKKVDFPNAFN